MQVYDWVFKIFYLDSSLSVNVGMKLLEFHQLSRRERFSSSGLRSQFLGSWSRKSTL